MSTKHVVRSTKHEYLGANGWVDHPEDARVYDTLYDAERDAVVFRGYVDRAPDLAARHDALRTAYDELRAMHEAAERAMTRLEEVIDAGG